MNGRIWDEDPNYITLPSPRFDEAFDLDRSCLEDVNPVRFWHYNDRQVTGSSSDDYNTNIFEFESNYDNPGANYEPVLKMIASSDAQVIEFDETIQQLCQLSDLETKTCSIHF